MDFELTKSQKEIQKAAREFAKGEFDKELALELDRKHEFPTKIWKKAGKIGLIGVHFPEQTLLAGQPAPLRGTGLLRYRLFIKAYVAAFYAAGPEPFAAVASPA